MKEKYTKKATAKIIAEVLKLNPKASKLTSLDQAFVLLMTHWDMELSLLSKLNEPTKAILYRDDDTPYEWLFENAWNDKEGDYDWNTIYKTVLEDIIKKKLYKRPKLGKRAQKKYEEEIAKKKAEREAREVEENKVEVETSKVSLVELRTQRGQLYAKISNWKKQKKDPNVIAAMEVQLEEIKKQIKEYK
jgi:hypothetical protein